MEVGTDLRRIAVAQWHGLVVAIWLRDLFAYLQVKQIDTRPARPNDLSGFQFLTNQVILPLNSHCAKKGTGAEGGSATIYDSREVNQEAA